MSRAATMTAMPALAAHEGLWDGVYRHVDRDFTLVEQHRMRTRCEFPDDGEFAYIQHNHASHDDGREERRTFGGTLLDGRIWWDTDRFSGWGWETDHGLLMLRLDRKDQANAYFTEMIEIAPDGNSRMRVWQWWKGGQPVRRTLCDEWRVSRDPAATL